MLKEERQSFILEALKKENIVQVSNLTQLLDVTDMTIRRDLKELEDKSLLVRIHGGARSLDKTLPREFTNEEKMLKNMDLKLDIAEKVAHIIKENSNIFLGAGTTLEYVARFLKNKNINIFTNSLYLFRKLIVLENVHVNLIGGEFRKITGAFVGSLSLDAIRNIRFDQSFIGVNGISDGMAFTYNIDEGILQSTILDYSKERYLIADHSKISLQDFYKFYNLDQCTVITDSSISQSKLAELEEYTDVIK